MAPGTGVPSSCTDALAPNGRPFLNPLIQPSVLLTR
jgi:hypothetical protein